MIQTKRQLQRLIFFLAVSLLSCYRCASRYQMDHHEEHQDPPYAAFTELNLANQPRTSLTEWIEQSDECNICFEPSEPTIPLHTAYTCQARYCHACFKKAIIRDIRCGLCRRTIDYLQLIEYGCTDANIIDLLFHYLDSENVDAIESLLKDNNIRAIAINSYNEFGYTPLHVAMSYNNKDIFGLLLRYDANPNIPMANGATLLHYAMQWGERDIVELLLQHNANVNAQTEDGFTPLHYAAQFGQYDLAEILLEHKACIEATTIYQATTLEIATQNNDAEFVDLLLSHYTNIHLQYKAPNPLLNCAAFIGACIQNNTKMVELFLNYYKRLITFYVPICGHKSEQYIDELLEFLIEIELDDDDMFVRQYHHRPYHNLILEKWIEVYFNGEPLKGLTLFQFAAFFCRVELCEKIFIYHGKKILNQRYCNGFTPLHFASYFGNQYMVDWLIQHKANATLKDHQQKTALDIAFDQGHARIIQLLNEKSSTRQAKTIKSWYPWSKIQ